MGRRLLPVALLVLVFQMLVAGPVAAHAELVGSDPASGASLDRPPSQVTLTFTEAVNPIADGFRLIDATGETVPTDEPSADAELVRLRMPADLPRGSYILSWRVLSSDGHPVSGAISFGIGAVAAEVESVATAQTATWPVVTVRYAGYLGFTVVTGALAFVLLCSPSTRGSGRVQSLVRVGLGVGAIATALAVLVQGPYVAGASLSAIGDAELVTQTLAAPFGLWAVWRLALYGALAALTWRLAWLSSTTSRWASTLIVAGIAFTFSGTGHAAASGQLVDRVTDSVHALTAGVWVGGLVVLTILGKAMSSEVVRRFSGVALVSVLILVATGLVNSWSHLTGVDDLWQTRYGGVLLVKSGLVLAALLAAYFSRGAVQRGGSPWSSVRVEAAMTVVVLGATSVLTLTSPPSQRTVVAGDPTSVPSQPAGNTVVEMDLGQGRTAELHIDGLTTGGSSLHLILLDAAGKPMPVNRVELTAGLASAQLGPLPVPLTKQGTSWVSDFDFALPGAWKLTLTVEDRSLAGVVTAGEVTIPS